ncbi:hypothetical protein GCM10027298_36410 [Epidermidibacterium keratini]
MSYDLHTTARTHVGKVRDNNEDSYVVRGSLLLVADGMGGHEAGEIASELTAASFQQIADTDPDSDLTVPLRDAVERATHAIASRIADEPELAGMGTTLTAVLFGNRRIVVANIGDSRLYVYHHDRRELVQVTKDDSFVQLMVDTGEITQDEAQHHPYRNVMLKALNGDEVEARFTTLTGLSGDRYLLCSDGLTDYVERDDIRTALEIESLDEAADRLIELTLEAGAPDNVTVVLAELVPAGSDDGRVSVGSGDTGQHGVVDVPPTEPIPTHE